jgi:hypothetical protein
MVVLQRSILLRSPRQSHPDIAVEALARRATLSPMRRTLVAASIAIAACAAVVSGRTPGQKPRGKACAYEENCDCPAPGITLRWKAAYCMATANTDDFENEAVQQCLATPDPAAVRGQQACAQNAYWKSELCRVVRSGKKDADACARDRKFIPDIVARGAGG